MIIMPFFDSGVGYSALGTTRSALSTFLMIDDKPAGEHPLVCRFLRGVFCYQTSITSFSSKVGCQFSLHYFKEDAPTQIFEFERFNMQIDLFVGNFSWTETSDTEIFRCIQYVCDYR